MAEQVRTHRARALNHATPRWVMVGLDWDGPGVLLMASDRLDRAQLDYEAGRVYEFVDMEDMKRRFRPSLALTVTIDTPEGAHRDGYVLIAAPDWGEAIRALFDQWKPGAAPLALDPPRQNEITTHAPSEVC